MVKDDGRQWLLELTQNITGQLKQNREDITTLREQMRTSRDVHVVCREQVLNEIAKIDKRVEVVTVKVGVYAAIITTVFMLMVEYFFKHWIK